MGRQMIDGMLRLWRSAADFGRDQRRRMAAAREMREVEPGERARILADAGLTPGEFGDIMRTPFVSENLLSQAMCAVGAAPASVTSRHGMWHRDMVRVCMACPARSRCRRDLATGDFARRYRHYCPNADSLAGLSEAEGHRA